MYREGVYLNSYNMVGVFSNIKKCMYLDQYRKSMRKILDYKISKIELQKTKIEPREKFELKNRNWTTTYKCKFEQHKWKLNYMSNFGTLLTFDLTNNGNRLNLYHLKYLWGTKLSQKLPNYLYLQRRYSPNFVKSSKNNIQVRD